MNKGGRPTDAVWDYFYKLDSNKTKCKHCGNVQVGKVARLKVHVAKCRKEDALYDHLGRANQEREMNVDKEVNHACMSETRVHDMVMWSMLLTYFWDFIINKQKPNRQFFRNFKQSDYTT